MAKRIITVLLFGLALHFSAESANSVTRRVRIEAEADALVTERSGSHRRLPHLLTAGTGFDGREAHRTISYIRFDLRELRASTLMSTVPIESARLSMLGQSVFYTGGQSSARGRVGSPRFFITVSSCFDNKWSAEEITWDSRPCKDELRGEDSIIIQTEDLPKVYTWDVTKGIIDARLRNDHKVTFAITGFLLLPGGGVRDIIPESEVLGFVRFWSSNRSDFGLSAVPTLAVTTSTIPTRTNVFLTVTLPGLAALTAVVSGLYGAYRGLRRRLVSE